MKFVAAITTAVAALAVVVVNAKKCQDITLPVSVTAARNGRFDQAALTPADNIAVKNFILNLSQQGSDYISKILRGYNSISGTYHLAATYCAPDSGPPSVVQVLTHGVGFDRSYWDFPFNNHNYSYVNEAVDHYGFATFSYDRLGIGQSDLGEPVNEIQVALEIASLKALTEKIRHGSIKGVPKFEKVLHVGHSFGSIQSYALSAMYPHISDGLALTGFSHNGSFVSEFELGGDYVQANLNPAFARYPNGYMASASASAFQVNFFSPNDFDPEILPAAFSASQPVTVGELLSIGGVSGGENLIKAPVLIITGERDVPFCGGNCLAPPTGFSSIPETSKALLPRASPFKVHIVKGAGHGLNFHYSHPETYCTILDFFVQNGVGPDGSPRGSKASHYLPTRPFKLHG